jgi:hypothetical protein
MTKSNRYDYVLTSLSYGRRLMLIGLIFVMNFCITIAILGFSQKLFPNGNERTVMLVGAAVQNVVAFSLSALFTAWFVSRKPLSFLGVDRQLTWMPIIGILIVFAVGFPFINQIVSWNESMHLPQCGAAIEKVLREWETANTAASERMMSTTSVSGLIVNVCVIGLLTGVCEELFFRGALQRVIASGGMSRHAAIWISAFIFSVMHFQFFGFVPRLLLGAFFGYLLSWTGSIWVSAFAHALNNSFVVVCTWMSNKNIIAIDSVDSFGITNSYVPIPAICSAIALLLIFVLWRKQLFKQYK